MTGMVDELIAFLRARLDEDEAWARAANQAYAYADKGSAPPDTGVHWEWVVGDNWEPATVDPMLDEFAYGPGGDWHVWLATAEQWPSTMSGEGFSRTSMMRRTYLTADEVDAAAGGHIARHDPARVLAEIDTNRWILSELASELSAEVSGSLGDQLVRRMLRPYRDHPDYRKEWDG